MLLRYFRRKMGQNLGIFWLKIDRGNVDHDNLAIIFYL